MRRTLRSSPALCMPRVLTAMHQGLRDLGVSGDTGLGQSDASDTGLERPQVRPLVHDSSTVGRAPSSPGMPSRRADLSFPISIEPLNPKP